MAIALAMVVVLTACGTAAFQHEESRLTFRVVRDTPGWYTGMPDGVEEFDLPVASGEAVEHIHAWWWPAAGGRADAPAILYLHGARWSLTGQLFRIEELRDFGFSVLAIDYRGFGKSDGDLPSEQTVYEDARAGWRWLVAHEPDAARRFIYG
ncbi:MAG TPA: alpha/beta hydrolase, partial [Casimicrobiaceae bacterium]|nr:alpha/beta hydrolase [Casimicrobiaceae bacterium]